MVQAISDAVADVAPQVCQAMAQHQEFEDIGKRMLMAWAEGVQGLRDARVYAVGDWKAGEAFEGFSAPPKLVADQSKIRRNSGQTLAHCSRFAANRSNSNLLGGGGSGNCH